MIFSMVFPLSARFSRKGTTFFEHMQVLWRKSNFGGDFCPFGDEKSSFFCLGHRSVISGLRISMFAPAHSRGALTP